MSQANPYEQYILELVNAERAKAGVQPLAFDGDLNESAELHSRWMLDTDQFSHTGAGGSNAGQRMTAAGYNFSGSWGWAENIGWASTRAPAGLQDEAATIHTGLMNSTGHRANLLNGSYREIGIGFETGDFQGWDAAMVTQNFARTATNPFLTGVAFDDKDGDRSYDVGEGLGGVTVTVTNSATGAATTTTTGAAGGYDLELAAGSYRVTFSAPAFASMTNSVTIGTNNVKLDWIDPASAGGTPTPTPTPTPTGVTLNGTTGADTLTGGSGDDVLNGNAGNDRLYGNAGADKLIGGTGNDTFYVDNSGDIVTEYTQQGVDTVVSTTSTYTLGTYVENLTLGGTSSIGGSGNDYANVLTGNSGANTLNGLGGNDTLLGNAGSDVLNGGAGNDVLNGGTGTDRLTGSTGYDRFDWNSTDEAGLGAARDVITDLVRGQDKIDLSGIDAIAGTAGNDAFKFVGSAAFSGAAGELHYLFSGSDTLVQGDVNGDQVADFEFLVQNQLANLQTTDFVL